MTKRILVAYTSNAGSTREVAEAVGKVLGDDGMEADVRRLEEVADLNPYQAVVVGGPMIMGWHHEAVKFLKKYQESLSRVPSAYFFTAMRLTKTSGTAVDGITVEVDPDLPADPRLPTRLSLKERFTTVEHYVRPVLRAAPKVKPMSVGIFGGKMDYTRLKLLQMLFVMLVVGVQPGDRRNWRAIQSWASHLRLCFEQESIRQEEGAVSR